MLNNPFFAYWFEMSLLSFTQYVFLSGFSALSDLILVLGTWVIINLVHWMVADFASENNECVVYETIDDIIHDARIIFI